jgi:hypothetical protein
LRRLPHPFGDAVGARQREIFQNIGGRQRNARVVMCTGGPSSS